MNLVLHNGNVIARLALAVAGRRVTQQVNARLFHVSLTVGVEESQVTAASPVPKALGLNPQDVLNRRTSASSRKDGDTQGHLHAAHSPKTWKKKAKKVRPSTKPKPKPKPKHWKNTPTAFSATRASFARSETLRNALLNNLGRKDRPCPERCGKTGKEMMAFLRGMTDQFNGRERTKAWGAPGEDLERDLPGGFRPEEWSWGWGRDELAPPAVEPASPSTSRRLPPPHRSLPYVRRTEGYIPDSGSAEECKSVLQDIESPSEHKPIARLAHGLDRVLFNPGVHWLQDPRSRVYNFSPWIESIPKVTDFAFERITGFVKSSKDTDLHTLAKRHKRPFAGSTSSLTGLLSHVYFLISGDKEVDTSTLSRAFVHGATTFTPGQRMPTSVVLNYKEGVWSIDADKADELAEKNVLTWMGTMLEKFLTLSEGGFKMLLRSAPKEAVEEDSDTRREAYRYAMSNRFVLRSQLDCVDPRLPGTGVFDIKTRAAVPIRLDVLNYEENSGYLIRKLTGSLESFEKEYYDLIRSAFLKYSFQVRIGNMDGVLIAYHNTARLFGFQYVSLEEMEATLYGSGNGTRVFNKCVLLLEQVLTDVVGVYGERSVRCTVEARERSQQLNVWIEPAEWDEQAEGKPSPITQLDVKVASYLQGEREAVRGPRAVADDRGWLLHWTISQSALEPANIRANLEDAQSRQLRALNYPAGIETMEEMEKRWHGLNFGGKTDEEASGILAGESGPSDPEIVRGDGPGKERVDPHARPRPQSPFQSREFRPANQGIELLRQLAREGRDETLREQAEGREKVVWGAAHSSWRGENTDSVDDAGRTPGVDAEDGSVEVGGVAVEVGDGAATLGESDVEPLIAEEPGLGPTALDVEGAMRADSNGSTSEAVGKPLSS
ncbi:Pet127-domain-containing protein [Gyrodon lividus]|nr:Pet127-domain-containing protein [Gyrodon lividus]